MSMNLILVKGKVTIWKEIYQSPTSVSKMVLASSCPTQAYKDWVTESRNGAFSAATTDHFRFIDDKIAKGFKWSMH